jgi:hypothetical protein
VPARRRAWFLFLLPLVVLASPAVSPTRVGAQTATTASAVGIKTWVGRHQEFEQFLKTAAPVGASEAIPVGVTAPRKIALAPGGPFDAMGWKAIKPGMSRGFYESYKSEIAAYELDKLLGLDMVPPYVERTIDGKVGAAVMWLDGVKSFKDLGGPPSPPPAMLAKWNVQLVRAKMFDNLIANLDPNLGNWLKDDSWNVILIDHSRSFTTTKKMTHEMTRVDRQLWAKIAALDEPALTNALGMWVGKKEIMAILDRREKMKQTIDKLVSKNGQEQVWVD